MNEQGEDFPHIYALRFTARARADIEAGRDWLEQMSGEKIADEWESGSYDVVATLATLPHRSMAPKNVRFQQEVRQLIYRRRSRSVAYRILYTIVEDSEDAPYIRILHIRHGSAKPITRAEARELEADR